LATPAYRQAFGLASKRYRLTVTTLVSKQEARKKRSSSIEHQKTSLDTSFDNDNFLGFYTLGVNESSPEPPFILRQHQDERRVEGDNTIR
jgi:hypothetical protein